jgi:hypothetical protein
MLNIVLLLFFIIMVYVYVLDSIVDHVSYFLCDCLFLYARVLFQVTCIDWGRGYAVLLRLLCIFRIFIVIHWNSFTLNIICTILYLTIKTIKLIFLYALNYF